MKNYLILILVIIGAFVINGWLSTILRRRFNLRRNFQIPQVTQKSRAIAIIAAFIFGVAYFIETSFLQRFHTIFLMIAIVALVYSFRKPQDNEEK
jgi:uncharacterized membrane protein YoaK (UPF0700 family)